MVNAMPASEFLRFSKAAKMLAAEKRMTDCESSAFPHLEEKDRKSLMSGLRKAAKQFLFEPLVDFKDFAASIAKAMKKDG